MAAAFTGDGATSEGDFHEAVNLAAVWKLPVIFVIENNQYGLSTPAHEQYACRHLADRGIGYGMPGLVVDGNDLLAVVRAVRRAAERARRGDGPTLLEFKTFRMRGHEEASGTDYVPKRASSRSGRRRTRSGASRPSCVEQRALRARPSSPSCARPTSSAIDALVDEALEAPEPRSTREREARRRVRAEPARAEARGCRRGGRRAPELRYVDAISDGLRDAMRRDERVVLLGQDIAEYGGVFKVTEGFAEEFGKARVRNTPIIESGAVGCALGLALDGFVPMVEMQFGDFISCGFNQIVNNLAKTHYRWGARVPVVIRAPIGGGTGAGPFHSQNVEAWFTAVAGLKVVAPATPYDAKGLLIAAFEDGNPVLYLEHKLLYRSAKGRVPAGHYTVPIGQARVAREGRDATVVTYGVGVAWALEAAAELAREGREIEVIDLRSLVPWDVEAVLARSRRPARCLVLHEAPLTGGFGGEIAATVGREAFEWLDAPVARLGALDTPVPFSKALEARLLAEGPPAAGAARAAGLLIRLLALLDPLHQAPEALALVVPDGPRGHAAPGLARAHARAREEHGVGQDHRALPHLHVPHDGGGQADGGAAPDAHRRDDEVAASSPVRKTRTLPPSTAWSSRAMRQGSEISSVFTNTRRPIFMPMAFRNSSPKGVRVKKGSTV